jgi:signal transduction histidine kinase
VIGQANIGLDAAGLEAISPFHCVLDASNRVVQIGRSLSRLVPEITLGAVLDGLVEVKNPSGPCTHAHLSTAIGRLVVLELPTVSNLTLRVQAIPSVDGNLALVGTPWFTEMSHIGACGLSLADFAPHEAITDLLLLIQSQSSSLSDATNMADALGALNQQLEMRVRQRTHALEEKTSALQTEIADRQRIESELRLAQKLESVGQLAAGIAHEINTPIQFVGDNLRFLGDSLKDLMGILEHLTPLMDAADASTGGPNQTQAIRAAAHKADLPYLTGELPKAVEQSLEGIERVASLVRALKEFSHPDSAEHKATDLNHAITNALTVARNEYKYVADVVVEADAKLPQVVCNVGEINQVLLNLLVNAAHAIGDTSSTRGRGTITLTTRQDGEWVELLVRDTGTGIPEAARAKIFDPFFTTKPVGKGTGQGLYLVHSIVTKKHHGTISFTTELGVGTTFVVRLPITPPAKKA